MLHEYSTLVVVDSDTIKITLVSLSKKEICAKVSKEYPRVFENKRSIEELFDKIDCFREEFSEIENADTVNVCISSDNLYPVLTKLDKSKKQIAEHTKLLEDRTKFSDSVFRVMEIDSRGTLQWFEAEVDKQVVYNYTKFNEKKYNVHYLSSIYDTSSNKLPKNVDGLLIVVDKSELMVFSKKGTAKVQVNCSIVSTIKKICDLTGVTQDTAKNAIMQIGTELLPATVEKLKALEINPEQYFAAVSELVTASAQVRQVIASILTQKPNAVFCLAGSYASRQTALSLGIGKNLQAPQPLSEINIGDLGEWTDTRLVENFDMLSALTDVFEGSLNFSMMPQPDEESELESSEDESDSIEGDRVTFDSLPILVDLDDEEVSGDGSAEEGSDEEGPESGIRGDVEDSAEGFKLDSMPPETDWGYENEIANSKDYGDNSDRSYEEQEDVAGTKDDADLEAEEDTEYGDLTDPDDRRKRRKIPRDKKSISSIPMVVRESDAIIQERQPGDLSNIITKLDEGKKIISPEAPDADILMMLAQTIARCDIQQSNLGSTIFKLGLTFACVGIIALFGIAGFNAKPSGVEQITTLSQQRNTKLEELDAKTAYQRMQGRTYMDYIPYIEFIGTTRSNSSITITDFNLIGDDSLRLNGSSESSEVFNSFMTDIEAVSEKMHVNLTRSEELDGAISFVVDVSTEVIENE